MPLTNSSEEINFNLEKGHSQCFFQEITKVEANIRPTLKHHVSLFILKQINHPKLSYSITLNVYLVFCRSK